MRFMVLIGAFCSGIVAYACNSTENRQQLFEIVDIAHAQEAIERLRIESQFADRNPLSVIAWNMYLNIFLGKDLEIVDPEAQQRLIEDGICVVRDSVLQLKEYYVSDELPALSRTVRFNKKGRS